MHPLLVIALLAAASYRTVKLWMEDRITQPLRIAVIGDVDEKTGEVYETGFLMSHPSRFTAWLLELLTCTWCLGIWVGGVATLVATLTGWLALQWTPAGVFMFLVIWFVVAAGSAWIRMIEGLFDVADEVAADYRRRTNHLTGTKPTD